MTSMTRFLAGLLSLVLAVPAEAAQPAASPAPYSVPQGPSWLRPMGPLSGGAVYYDTVLAKTLGWNPVTSTWYDGTGAAQANPITLDFTAMASSGALGYGLAYTHGGVVTGGVTSTTTSAWDNDGNAYGLNQPVLTSTGIHLDVPATQYLTNPAAPATQTITLAAGTYTAFCRAPATSAPSPSNALTISGAVTPVIVAAAGTGNPTGAAICSQKSQTPGLPFVFSVSGASTSVTVTVSGSIQWANVTNTAFVTGPILAAAAGTTRTYESLIYSGTGFTGTFNQSAGTFYVEYAPRGCSASCYLYQAYQDNNNRIEMSGGSGNFRHVIVVGGGVTQNGDTGNPVPGRLTRVASAYDAGGSYVQRDMHALFTTSGTTLPSGITTLYIGNNSAGTSPLSVTIARIVIFPTKLNATQVRAATFDQLGFIDNFQRPDGPPGTALSGAAWVQAAVVQKHGILNRLLNVPLLAGGLTVAYSAVDLGAGSLPTEMGALYVNTSSATTSCTTSANGGALVSNPNNATLVTGITTGAAHMVFGTNGYGSIQYFSGGSNTAVATYAPSVAQVTDGVTPYYFGWIADPVTNLVTMITADRKYYASIAPGTVANRGRYVTWESYGGSGLCVALFSSIWVRS